MRFDGHTLRDMEIFASADGGPGVFALMDLTLTEGGSRYLRGLFSKGCSSPEEALAISEAIRFMQSHLDKNALKIHRNQFVFIEQYIKSKLPGLKRETPGDFAITAIRTALSHKETGLFSNLEYITEGIRYVSGFISVMTAFPDAVSGARQPGLILREASGISAMLNTIPAGIRASFDKEGRSVLNVLRTDRWARGKGKKVISDLTESFYRLDALAAAAKAAERHGMHFAVFDPEGGLNARGLRHPFLKSPVRQDLSLKKNLLFLTGPNMAGKTTFLKSLAISVYLAHIGLPVFADHLSTPFFDALFTGIHTDDNIRAGYSYFFSEVNRVKKAAELLQGGGRCLFIFDELFKGTNVKDAFDSSKLVIDKLSDWDSSYFILSSHLLELAEELEKPEKIRFMCFGSSVVDGRPAFDYNMTDGVSAERLGLVILRLEGIDRLLENKGT